MKVRIRQRDVLSPIAPAPVVLSAGEMAFSGHIDPPRRDRRLTQGFPEIQEIDPAAVPETPLRIREAIHFRLYIEMRTPGAKYPLFEGKPLAPQREFRCQTNLQGRIVHRGELRGLPLQVAEVQGMVQRTSGIQPQPQISSMYGDRRLGVVVENPPVDEQKAPDVQLEKRVAPWLIYRGRPPRRGHVCRAVLFNSDVQVGPLHDELIQ